MTSSTSFAVPKVTWFFVAVAWVVFAHSILLTVVAAAPRAEEYEVELNLMSDFSRSLAAQSAVPSSPESPRVRRRRFPQTDSPHVCLAFLSCCDRIDLLNHTLAAAIRHMEEDEPHNLRYEIAWVDNGSEAQLTDEIMKNYQIEHALPMDQNLGLAFGMNLLIQNLCTAPYILLLEEDWLYLDDLVVEQTDRRTKQLTMAARSWASFCDLKRTAAFFNFHSWIFGKMLTWIFNSSDHNLVVLIVLQNRAQKTFNIKLYVLIPVHLVSISGAATQTVLGSTNEAP